MPANSIVLLRNSYRSSISSAQPPIDGVLVGKHPTVLRFMQGVLNSQAPCPKYILLNLGYGQSHYLHSLGPLENLSRIFQ